MLLFMILKNLELSLIIYEIPCHQTMMIDNFLSFSSGAACPLGKRIGSNCQVSDPVAGYSFDLTPLSNARPVQGKDYFSEMDSRKEYEYQIKVFHDECDFSFYLISSINLVAIGLHSRYIHMLFGRFGRHYCWHSNRLSPAYFSSQCFTLVCKTAYHTRF